MAADTEAMKMKYEFTTLCEDNYDGSNDNNSGFILNTFKQNDNEFNHRNQCNNISLYYY